MKAYLVYQGSMAHVFTVRRFMLKHGPGRGAVLVWRESSHYEGQIFARGMEVAGAIVRVAVYDGNDDAAYGDWLNEGPDSMGTGWFG